MKFGTFLMQIDGADLANTARRADELGFESGWIPEHIIMPVVYRSPYPYAASGRLPAPADTPLHDPMLALAFIAGVTRRLKLATGIFVLPLRNPFATAKAVASLDNLSGGRFLFGIGIGWLKEEFEAVGADFEHRAARTREYLALMERLWSEADPQFHGKTLHLEGFKFMPKPLQQPHPPLIFGGHTDPSMKRAAQLGDGWYGIAESLEHARELITRLRRHEREQSRPQPLEITLTARIGRLPSVDDVKRLGEMGVARLIVGTGISARDAIAGMEQFRDRVMAAI